MKAVEIEDAIFLAARLGRYRGEMSLTQISEAVMRMKMMIRRKDNPNDR